MGALQYFRSFEKRWLQLHKGEHKVNEDECVCGHNREDHSKEKFFSECTVDGCECIDFELFEGEDFEEIEDDLAPRRD